MIWSLTPKSTYSGAFETKLAVELGTLLFNVGFKKTFQSIYNELGLSVTKNMLEQWDGIDKEKQYNKHRQEKEEFKLRRKALKRKKLNKNDAFVHQEGDTYESASFHGGKKAKKVKTKSIKVKTRSKKVKTRSKKVKTRIKK